MDALSCFLYKKDTTIEKELEYALTRIYEKNVPPTVREFLETKATARPGVGPFRPPCGPFRRVGGWGGAARTGGAGTPPFWGLCGPVWPC